VAGGHAPILHRHREVKVVKVVGGHAPILHRHRERARLARSRARQRTNSRVYRAHPHLGRMCKISPALSNSWRHK
jgi:hypothetical protein